MDTLGTPKKKRKETQKHQNHVRRKYVYMSRKSIDNNRLPDPLEAHRSCWDYSKSAVLTCVPGSVKVIKKYTNKTNWRPDLMQKVVSASYLLSPAGSFPSANCMPQFQARKMLLYHFFSRAGEHGYVRIIIGLCLHYGCITVWLC